MGATTVNGGGLVAGAANAFSPNSVVTVASGATFNLNGNNNTVSSLTGPTGGSVSLGAGTLTIASGGGLTYSGAISGIGGVTLTAGTFTLAGANNYSGATTVNGGILTAGSTSAFGLNSAVTVASGGTLSVSTFNNTIGSLTGAAGGTVNLGTATLTVANGSGLTYAGSVTGAGTLALTTGTLTLSGNNSFGSMAVNGGTLNAGSTTAFGGANVTVANGATLAFSTFANTVGALINSGSISSSALVTALSYIQNSTLTLNFPMVAATPVGSVSTTGPISLNGTLVVTNTGGFAPGTGQEIILLQSSGAGKQLSGAFTSTLLPFANGVIHYDYSDNHVILSTGAGASCNSNWIAASGNWGVTANWSAGCAPGVSGMAANNDSATFTSGSGGALVTLANAAGTMAQSVTLHDLTFNTSSSSYTIQQFSGAGTIILDGSGGSTKPKIHLYSGTHAIQAPIVLNKDSRFSLHGGILTLGSTATIFGAGALNISEGATSETLVVHGQVNPASILMDGGTLVNYALFNPAGTIEISGTGGIAVPATVNNHGTLRAGAAFTIGADTGPTIVNNFGTMSGVGTFTVASGTVNNAGGGLIFTNPGGTILVTGGLLENGLEAVVGRSNGNITVSGGILSSLGQIVANNYTQTTPGVLSLSVSSISTYGNVSAGGTVNLGGPLIVNALNFQMTDGQTVSLFNAPNGFSNTTFSSILFQNFPSSIIPTVLYFPGEIRLDIREAVATHSHGAAAQVFVSAVG